MKDIGAEPRSGGREWRSVIGADRSDETMEIPRHIGAHVDSLASSTVLFAVSFDTIMELSKSNERWSGVLGAPPTGDFNACTRRPPRATAPE